MDPLTRLQDDIAAALQADAYFDALPVLVRSKGVTEQDIANALGTLNEKSGKTGVVVVVMMPEVDVPLAEPPGPRMEISLMVRVIEMPVMNRDEATGIGLTAEDIALNILHVLHGRKVSPEITQIHAAPQAITPVDIDGVVAYDLKLLCRFGLASPSRVTHPVISGNASAVHISCNTPDASIYYALDGSFPWVGNAQALLFGITLMTEEGVIIVTEDGNPLNVANPIAIDPGVTLRTAAYAAGKQGSDVSSAIF